MIEVLEKRQWWCVLHVSRGSGPRAVQQWVEANQALCFEKEHTTTTIQPATGKTDGDNDVSIHPYTCYMASQFYSAYAQSLVLFVRYHTHNPPGSRQNTTTTTCTPNANNRASSSIAANVVLTVHCLVKGTVETKQTLKQNLHDNSNGILDDDNTNSNSTIVQPLAVAPSNSLGTMTLVKAWNTTANGMCVAPRQFRRHLKGAGHSVLGRAKDASPFRGEALCMAVTRLDVTILEENINDSSDYDSCSSQQYQWELPVPHKFATLMEREERFYWKRRAAAAPDDSIRTSAKAAATADADATTTTALPLPSTLPAAYATGETKFCGIPLAVTPDVMIPRKGSAALVNLVVARQRQYNNTKRTPATSSSSKSSSSFTLTDCDNGSALRVLDLGTGSGCLLIAILHAIKAAAGSSSTTTNDCNSYSSGVGIDASRQALVVAALNARASGFSHRECSFLQATFANLSCLSKAQNNGNNDNSAPAAPLFDVVVCNPPYHTRGGRKLLDEAVVQHEPGAAIFVDDTGDMLVHYRDALRSLVGGGSCSDNACLLAYNAIVVFEVFKDNAASVSALMVESGLSNVTIGVDARGSVRTAHGVWLV